jgi:hypothetical protein
MAHEQCGVYKFRTGTTLIMWYLYLLSVCIWPLTAAHSQQASLPSGATCPIVKDALDRFSNAINAYANAKRQQEKSIRARFPGDDPSYNIGMWTAKEQASQAVKAKADTVVQGLRDRRDNLRNAASDLLSMCSRIEGGQGTPAPTTSLSEECTSLARAAQGLASNAAEFGDAANVKVDRAGAAMGRYPGFDASMNIVAWAQNVGEFDRVYQEIDEQVAKLSEQARELIPSLNRSTRSCAQ